MLRPIQAGKTMEAVIAACKKSLEVRRGRPTLIFSSEEKAQTIREQFANLLSKHPRVLVTSFEELKRKKEEKSKMGKAETWELNTAKEQTRIINQLASEIYQRNVIAGWYTNLHTGRPYAAAGTPEGRNIPEMLMLIVSEIAEAMEGYRKSLPDDKLPHRPMIEVELADAMIRIFDLAGYMQLDLGGAIAEKRAYNAQRADHKLETRQQGGKKF